MICCVDRLPRQHGGVWGGNRLYRHRLGHHHQGRQSRHDPPKGQRQLLLLLFLLFRLILLILTVSNPRWPSPWSRTRPAGTPTDRTTSRTRWSAPGWTPAARTPARATPADPSCAVTSCPGSSPGDTAVPSRATQVGTEDMASEVFLIVFKFLYTENHCTACNLCITGVYTQTSYFVEWINTHM